MDAYVILATKGRAQALSVLLDSLGEQRQMPRHTYVVGTSPADLMTQPAQGDVLDLQTGRGHRVSAKISDRAGLCAQRNVGIEALLRDRKRDGEKGRFFVAFFDDDFRPAKDWLSECARVFVENDHLAGVTGHVLADGVTMDRGVTEEEAEDFLSGVSSPKKHWASGATPRPMRCAYGCNMAFRANVIEDCRFDERLPLYGWQEDRDFSARAGRLGEIEYRPECRGVHLGVKSGRISGRQFGYSQVANPWYLSRKGTMTASTSVNFIARHMASNLARSLSDDPHVDYAGRLTGNLMAFKDLLAGRCRPERVVEM